MPAQLVPVSPGAAAAIDLGRPVILIGRHPECDARVELPQVSRRHLFKMLLRAPAANGAVNSVLQRVLPLV